MRRPLQELPLHQFLPPMPNNKRPLSPGETAMISPAKRRNLAGQGIFSPERTFKSPPSSRSTALVSRFSSVLVGPQSPARILDFGLPKHLAGDPEKHPFAELPVDDDVDLTPRRQPSSSSSRLAPSPELKPQGIRTRRPETDDALSTAPLCRPNISPQCSYTLIPRELPPRPDPHSVHYPGFIVHQDPHIFSYNSPPCHDDREVEEDGEESWKENSPVAVTKNLVTPRSSSFPKAFLDGDKNTSSSNFKPASSVRTKCAELAGKTSVALFKRNVDKSLEAKKNSRRILLEELDFEDCVTEE